MQTQLLVLVALGLFSFMSSQIVYPTLPLYVLGIGGTELALGLILSISSIMIISMRIPIGITSDRVGPWNILSLSLIGQSMSNFLCLFVSDISWLYPIRAVQGLAAAALNPILISITSGLATRERKGRILSIYLTTPAASMMVGPALNSLLVQTGGYAATFAVGGLLPLAGFFASLLALRARVFEQDNVNYPEPERGSRGTGSMAILRSLAQSKRVAAISIARASFSTTDGIFGTIFAVFVVHSLSLPVYMIGLFFAVKGLANTLVRWPAGLFADRVGGKKPALLAFIMTAAAFTILSEAQSIWLIALTMTMIGLAWGTRAVTEWVLVANLPGGSSTVGTAYLSMMFDVGEAAGALLAGVLMTFLPLSGIFKVAALIVTFGAIPLAVTKI